MKNTPQAPTASQAAGRMAASEESPRSYRVLVAEDDAEMRALLSGCLAEEGYEVVPASNGEDLLRLVTGSMRHGLPIDLVVSDVRMPGLGGFEAMEWYRALGCRAPVVVITGFGDRDTSLEAVRMGVVRVLDKPFELETLRTLARELFAARPARRRGWV